MVSDAVQCTTRSPTTPIGAGAPRSVRASTRARPSAVRDDDAGPADHPGRAVGEHRPTRRPPRRGPAAPLRRGNAPTAATGTNGPTASRCGREPVGTAASGTPTAATNATAVTARNGVSRNAKSAVPERATRRAGTRNSPERRAPSAAATAASPAASASHAPAAPDAPHPASTRAAPSDGRETCHNRRPPCGGREPPGPRRVRRSGLVGRSARMDPRIARAAASTAIPAGTATAAAHDPIISTPVHVSGGSSVTGPAPRSTAPRSARHHGSSVAAAAATASVDRRRDLEHGPRVGRVGRAHRELPREAARQRPTRCTRRRAPRHVIGRARHARATAGLRWCSVTGDLSTTGAAPSVFPALEALLPRVAKPVQYVGGELNARVKPWDGAQVRWALMYPDAYEVGLPNQGIQILYEILNERPDALAERCYAVWPDLEALMREAGVPAFTVDAHRPLGAFDVLGVSFSTELGYTNLLTALDLAGIPLHAVDRDEQPPGRRRRWARGVQPGADRGLRRRRGDRRRRGGRRRHHRRRAATGRPPGARAVARELLLRLAETPGCYVPSLYAVSYGRGRRDRRGRARRARASRAPCRSAPPSTSTPGPTRRPRSCRWPRPCTSARASRSSAAARAAAASARPG